MPDNMPVTPEELVDLVERLNGCIERQQERRGDYLYRGSADPELVDARNMLQRLSEHPAGIAAAAKVATSSDMIALLDDPAIYNAVRVPGEVYPHPDTPSAAKVEPVAWLYEYGEREQFCQKMRAPGNSLKLANWTETPLYASPEPPSDEWARAIEAAAQVAETAQLTEHGDGRQIIARLIRALQTPKRDEAGDVG